MEKTRSTSVSRSTTNNALCDHLRLPFDQGVYKSFLSSCSKVDQETLPQLHFMGTCVVEIYSLSPESAYQNAFKFIKDLAIDLRDAIVAKDKDAAKKVRFCIPKPERWTV